MRPVEKSKDIGMRGLSALPNLKVDEQFDLIAQGLPILMTSADELLTASEILSDQPRAAGILEGQALEEMAKILILLDLVRCPAKLRSSRTGQMVRWFYDHLARLLYVEAQPWRPVDANQLQDYLNDQRKSHYLEGGMGEFIMPNWSVFARESSLYADVVREDDGRLQWNEPDGRPMRGFAGQRHHIWQLCNALRSVGTFTRAGLDVVATIWGTVDFKGDQQCNVVLSMGIDMVQALDEAGVLQHPYYEKHLREIYHHWQMPMYHMDFGRLDVELGDLKAQQEANLASEMGLY